MAEGNQTTTTKNRRKTATLKSFQESRKTFLNLSLWKSLTKSVVWFWRVRREGNQQPRQKIAFAQNGDPPVSGLFLADVDAVFLLLFCTICFKCKMYFFFAFLSVTYQNLWKLLASWGEDAAVWRIWTWCCFLKISHCSRHSRTPRPQATTGSLKARIKKRVFRTHSVFRGRERTHKKTLHTTHRALLQNLLIRITLWCKRIASFRQPPFAKDAVTHTSVRASLNSLSKQREGCKTRRGTFATVLLCSFQPPPPAAVAKQRVHVAQNARVWRLDAAGVAACLPAFFVCVLAAPGPLGTPVSVSPCHPRDDRDICVCGRPSSVPRVPHSRQHPSVPSVGQK